MTAPRNPPGERMDKVMFSRVPLLPESRRTSVVACFLSLYGRIFSQLIVKCVKHGEVQVLTFLIAQFDFFFLKSLFNYLNCLHRLC